MIDTAPDVTLKSDESKDATPLFDVVASSASIVTTLLVTSVLIPSPPVNVRSESRRLTVSVPVSAATERVVEILTLAAAVKRPWASTVKVGICETEPYEPADTAVLSKRIVTVLLASLDVLIPGTPRIEKVSVSKSIVSVPEESVAIVRVVAPATSSTYSFVARELVPNPDLSL